MVDGLRRHGWSVEIVELEETFPYPTAAALEGAGDALAAIPAGTAVLVDSLALGAMPGVIEREALRLPVVALVHLPLAADRTLDHETVVRFEIGERCALSAVRLIVVTGAAALPLLERYELPPNRVAVVEPGTDPAPLARGSGGGPLTLLAVATLNPTKGHDILLAALATIPHLDWRLVCAGSLTRHTETADRVRALAEALNLTERVSFVGDLNESALAECYDRADLFVSASQQETYGMAIAEALARGLPVVATMTGASPKLVGDTAGLLVPPGDTAALAEAIAHVLGDADLRARLAAGARLVRERLPDWNFASAQLAAALESLDLHG